MVVDPLDFSPGGGSLSEYARAFGPGSSVQSPANAGFSASLERLEFLLRRGSPVRSEEEVVDGVGFAPPLSLSLSLPPLAAGAVVTAAAVAAAAAAVVGARRSSNDDAPGAPDSSSSTTSFASRTAALGARLRAASCNVLDPLEADLLACALDSAPRAVLTSGVRPAALPSLVTNAPAVAAAFLAATALTGPPAMLEAYIQALLPRCGEGEPPNEARTAELGGGGGAGLGVGAGAGAVVTVVTVVAFASASASVSASISASASAKDTSTACRLGTPPLSLRNLEVAHMLLLRRAREGDRSGLPADLRDRHLSAALACASAGGGARGVRLVCAYVRALARDGLLKVVRGVGMGDPPPPPVVEELKAFAIAHAKVPEAAELFRYIVQDNEGRLKFETVASNH